MATPSPVFPAGIATDAQLKVANNLITTTLSVSVDNVSTVLVVGSSVGFVVNGLISVDNEIMSISAVANSLLTLAGRGFDGTAAAPHSAGAKVSMFIDAWHHNALAAEIKAIEGFIGPNGQNITNSNLPFLVSSAFVFQPQSPGGSLTVGNNVVTLSPVPQGVNGTDTSHYLYISGGTGTAEPVLITGGTAVAGAPSGTVIVNCVNAHSGAWTIQSATSGIMEAVITLAPAGASPNYGGGLIFIPAGGHTLYSQLHITRGNVILVGAGVSSTTLYSPSPTGDIVFFDGGSAGSGQNEIRDLSIQGPNTAGSYYGLTFYNQNWSRVANVVVTQCSNGVKISGTSYSFANQLQQMIINYFKGDGVTISAGSGGCGVLDRITIAGDNTSATNGIHITNTVGAVIVNSYIQTCGNGFLVDGSTADVAFIDVVNTLFDSNVANGMVINPSGTARAIGLRFTHGGAGATTTGDGVFIGSGIISGIKFENWLALQNAQTGFMINGGSDISLVNCDAIANSTSSSGGYPGLSIAAAATRVQILGGTYGAAWGEANSQNYGMVINAGASYITLKNTTVTPNVTGAIAVGAITNSQIISNLGYNPVGQSAITVSASPFTYTNGSTPATVYIFGGTVSNVQVGSGPTQVAAASPCQVSLAPNERVIVTYSAAPTMVADVQ